MNNPRFLYIGISLLVTVIIFAGFNSKKSSSTSTAISKQVESSTSTINVPVEVVGQNYMVGIDQVGVSWPGEIISYGEMEVQPEREGTIVEWRVKIGQKISRGQVLARLSAPPATPDLTRSLAEQLQSLTRARETVKVQTIFVEKNKEQLMSLRNQIVSSGRQISDSLSNEDSSERTKSLKALQIAHEISQEDIQIKTQSVKDYSIKSIRKILPLLTNYSSDPITAYKQYPHNFNFSLLYGLGDYNDNTKTEFKFSLVEALDAVINNDKIIGDKILKFLQNSDTLLANSYPTNESNMDLPMLRNIISDERSMLLEKIIALTEAKNESTKIESEIATKKIEFSIGVESNNKETSEKIKDIDEKLIDLDLQLQLARVEANAATVAYNTISKSLIGGLDIVAPRSGIISIILKKNGDFVSPGIAVASVSSGSEKDRFVRFKVPNNVTLPQTGDVLAVIRPGFPKDNRKVKLIGISTSLESNGSFLADADFVDSVDWPVYASIRVLPYQSSGDQILISLSAVWWNEDGNSFVWLVTEENRIRPQEIKTGRAIGDKIEVSDGLVQGSRIVSYATSNIKTGMQLDESYTGVEKNGKEENEQFDGHGH